MERPERTFWPTQYLRQGRWSFPNREQIAMQGRVCGFVQQWCAVIPGRGDSKGTES